MTSLPNEPLHANFCKLTPIGRDTIVLETYDLPEDFNPSIDQLTQHPKATFQPINLKELNAIPAANVVYVRQTPIHYIGEMGWSADDNSNNKGGFLATYLTIDHEKITFGTNVYDKDKQRTQQSIPVFLRKLNRLNPAFK